MYFNVKPLNPDAPANCSIENNSENHFTFNYIAGHGV